MNKFVSDNKKLLALLAQKKKLKMSSQKKTRVEKKDWCLIGMGRFAVG